MGSLPAITDLDRRMGRKIDTGKGMQLTPEDLDLLVTSGAYAVLQKAAGKARERQCLQRSARNHSINGGITSSTAERDGSTSKSSGTIASNDVNEALARARLMTGVPG